MSYAQYGLIQASDFNTFVGGIDTTTANTLNATWGKGASTAGYGQTQVANVAAGQTVVATSYWNSLVANTNSAATHQGSSITVYTAPTAGGTVTYLSAIPTNLSTIYTNRLNANVQGSTSSNTATYGSTWSNALTFTHTATFATADQARYFFNAGGQLKMTCSHPSGTGIDLLFNNLASNVGTVVLSAPTSGTVTIVGTSYAGVQKQGGGGNAPTVDSTKGFYGLTSANSTIFTQTASTGPGSYLGTFIRFIAATNVAGTAVTIYSIWDEVPDGLTVSTGSAVTMTAQAPETTNLANSWGTITLAGSVTGS